MKPRDEEQLQRAIAFDGRLSDGCIRESPRPGRLRAFSSTGLFLISLFSIESLYGEETPAGSTVGDRARYTALRAAAPVRIDGVLDDAAWAGAPTFELAYETRPGENTPAKVRTEGWVAFDDEFLYFAFHAFDPEPEKIRARYTDRDRAFQDDFVGLVIDTFNDERRAFEFFVNPLGVQMDLIQDDVTQNEDDSWDAIWNSAGRIVADGWTVEAAIPLSSLRFKEGNGTWGFDALRIHPRENRTRIGLNPLARGRNCYLCQEAKLDGLEGIRPGRDLELDPTFTAGRTDRREPFPTGSFEKADDATDFGLTARWGVTPDLTLLGTVNPDFSQVESDAAQLDVNNQFALFYAEKRPFFLEGADYFATGINVAYTRNIADPAWGLKLIGKPGKNAVGLIVAEDRVTNLLLPGSEGSELASLGEESTATIGRYRRDILGTSTVGAIYAGREGDGYHNRVLGLDSSFRFGERHRLQVQAMGSRTIYPEAFAVAHAQPTGELDGHALEVAYDYTSEDWFGYFRASDFARDFRADLGFEPQVDYRKGVLGLERIWNGDDKHWYTQMRVGGDYDETYDQSGNLLEREAEFWWQANGPMQSFVNLGPGRRTKVYQGREFDQNYLNLYAEVRPTGSLYFYVEGTVGDEIDYSQARAADGVTLAPGVRLDIGRHLRLTLDEHYQALDVESQRLFTAQILELRATYQFNLRTFVRLISQYVDIQRDTDLYATVVEAESRELFNQLLFSYKINPQTVLFVGYSDTAFGSPSIDLTQESRTVFLKLGYAWRL